MLKKYETIILKLFNNYSMKSLKCKLIKLKNNITLFIIMYYKKFYSIINLFYNDK